MRTLHLRVSLGQRERLNFLACMERYHRLPRRSMVVRTSFGEVFIPGESGK